MKIRLILFALSFTPFFLSCQQSSTSETVQDDKGMVKVTILYPNGEGKTFDMDYYSNKHMPMVASLLGGALKKLEIDKGLGGRSSEEPMPYMAIGYLYFDKLSDYQDAFGPVAEKIVGDIPNYTNTQPLIQISEVLQ